MSQPDRYFSPSPEIRKIAMDLYGEVADLPVISPHGHVDPHLFSDPAASFGSPVDLFILPDHYMIRMLYSQGIALEDLGIPRLDGGRVETDHRKIWRLFCGNFHLFLGTPSGIWLMEELSEVFRCHEKPSATNADRLFDEISERLSSPDFSPRSLYKRFNIEVLATTDAATDLLDSHLAIRDSGWKGRIIPTFRPDALIDLSTPNWIKNIQKLSDVSGIDVVNFPAYIRALEQRRKYFKAMGAVAADYSPPTLASGALSPTEADQIFQRAIRQKSLPEDAHRFSANMLMEMARMSIEDGLVLQIHPGVYRNHNQTVFHLFGPDKGGDIPLQVEFTHNLFPLLNEYGCDPRLTLVIFTLDEASCSRELAPLAGSYPALKIGSPWWFQDSLNGIDRFFDQIMETAGLYNTAGFNDDARSFCSIPARHDIWRRASANWVAGLIVRRMIDKSDARMMMRELAVDLAKRTYKL